MKFSERLTGIFTKPGETMKDIMKEPRIEEALVIVGIYAILAMLSTYITSSRIHYVYDIPGAGAGLQTFTTIITLIMGLIMPLIAWPIIAGILHLFSMVFGGSGKFYPHIMTGIGYSEIVKIITVIISMLLLTQVPVITLEISSATNLSSVSSITSQMYSNPFYILSTIVVLIGLLCSCYLGALAIKEGEKLTMTQALLVVGIPLVLYLAVTYGTMLLGLI